MEHSLECFLAINVLTQGRESLQQGEIHMADSKASKERSRVVTGMFRDRDDAERAYQSITSRGYDTSDVNLLMSEDTRKKHFSSDKRAETELGNKALEGAGAGAGIGGTIGAILAVMELPELSLSPA
jgi:hypothetical protein